MPYLYLRALTDVDGSEKLAIDFSGTCLVLSVGNAVYFPAAIGSEN